MNAHLLTECDTLFKSFRMDLFWIFKNNNINSSYTDIQKYAAISPHIHQSRSNPQQNEQQTNRTPEWFRTVWVRYLITTTIKLFKYCCVVLCIRRTSENTPNWSFTMQLIYMYKWANREPYVRVCVYSLRFVFGYFVFLVYYCACPFHFHCTITAVAFVFRVLRVTEKQQ